MARPTLQTPKPDGSGGVKDYDWWATEPSYYSTNPFVSPPATPVNRPPSSGGVSPVEAAGDLSRLSGFPGQSGTFNFGSGHEPPSPTGPNRPQIDPNQLIVRNQAEAPVSTQVQSNAVYGGVHRPIESCLGDREEAAVDPPPPYTRAPQPAEWTGVGGPLGPTRPPVAARPPIQLQSQQYFTHQERHHRHQHRRQIQQRPPSNPSSAISGRRALLPLTLQDLHASGTAANRAHRVRTAVEHRHHQAQQKRRVGNLFDCCGGGRSDNEKRRRTRRIWLYWLLGIFVLSVVVILAAVLGVNSLGKRGQQSVEAETESKSSADGFPVLPLDELVVQPFSFAKAFTTCSQPPTLWSCELPPDSTFPVTKGSNDGARVPEFTFLIRQGYLNESSVPESLRRPNPSNFPLDEDYKSVATFDDIEGAAEGESTPFSISLITDRQSSPEDQQESPADMVPRTISNQPLRLFDRGQESEHYGFHIYFDKTIHMNLGEKFDQEPNAEGGGASVRDANMVIKWKNTRFKVSIYTGNDVGMVVRGEGAKQPIEVWEDRVGGDASQRVIAGSSIKGESQNVKFLESDGGGTARNRGCSCMWRNFIEEDDD